MCLGLIAIYVFKLFLFTTVQIQLLISNMFNFCIPFFFLHLYYRYKYREI